MLPCVFKDNLLLFAHLRIHHRSILGFEKVQGQGIQAVRSLNLEDDASRTLVPTPPLPTCTAYSLPASLSIVMVGRRRTGNRMTGCVTTLYLWLFFQKFFQKLLRWSGNINFTIYREFTDTYNCMSVQTPNRSVEKLYCELEAVENLGLITDTVWSLVISYHQEIQHTAGMTRYYQKLESQKLINNSKNSRKWLRPLCHVAKAIYFILS